MLLRPFRCHSSVTDFGDHVDKTLVPSHSLYGKRRTCYLGSVSTTHLVSLV